RLQQKAYDMTLLQEKEAQLNRRLEEVNRELEASNDFLVRISTKISHYLAPPTRNGTPPSRSVTSTSR
ncbi:MAG TPA: hypothetical protein VFS08_07795, partial [Gemmatimonadaceae bacterium]|nr:hypothetical protein [Gemmatimonadaceae bacterium]